MHRTISGVFAIAAVLLSLAIDVSGAAAADNWYTEQDYAPAVRIELTLVNTLDVDRPDCPVTITRDMFPIQSLRPMWVTIVDPGLPPNPKPTAEERKTMSGHAIGGEPNGHQIFRQVDDLDRDGVWDELFFQTDLAAGERKTMYVYIGFSQRGWNPHGTHAEIGSYCRHLIPFWESANVGWKFWYADTADVFGKRDPQLMSWELSINNLDGYKVKPSYGSDIQRVDNSFGGGAIALFEHVAYPDSVSRPRFTPRANKKSPYTWNEGEFEDTRYAYEVVVNGPVRSIMKAKGMNWDSGSGFYEYEQYYTIYTNQSYSTCLVTFTKFHPLNAGTTFCCGIRKNGTEFGSSIGGNYAMTFGKDVLSDPDDPTGANTTIVDFVGNALVVPAKYKPEYVFVPGFNGNHTFRIRPDGAKTFEYAIFAAWSEGQVYNTPAAFEAYVKRVAQELDNPVQVITGGVERKGN